MFRCYRTQSSWARRPSSTRTASSRDEAADERLERLNDREGVWRCRIIFNCTEACPREIKITRAIGEVKKAILYGTART